MVKLKIVTLALFLIAVSTVAMFSQSHNSVTAAPPVQETRIQGWTTEDRQTFYHTAQGTRFFPYSWLLALEAPGKLTREPFLTEERIRRFRMIADPNTLKNPDQLPVGVAKEVSPEGEFVSLTCAACHTGQIGYNGRMMRIDGGPSMHSVAPFIENAYLALADTYARPFKFQRFAKKVLGEDATFRQRLKLHGDIRKEIFAPHLFAEMQAKVKRLYPTEEGFGRLDALGRGVNLMAAIGLGDNRNLMVANAPVSYPHLWGTPFFDWTQWNGSIGQPLARNIAEALGVDTPITLKGKTEDLFKSSVNIQNLFLLEQILMRLEPPRWPADLLGPIDGDKAAQGAALYQQHCASCHESKMAPPNEFGKTFVRIEMYPLDQIGTDPTAAVNFNKRLVHTGQLSQPPYSLPARLTGTGTLQAVTTQVAKRKFEELQISPDMQNEMNGYRQNMIRAPLAYRARNMDGIWATPPFLHNNSVPNMYQLLLPVAQRDKRFHVGNLQYDPKVLGFDTSRSPDAFELRTNITGNSNAGHEFRDGPQGKGVIGPLLTDEERWAIIEYLKTK